MADENTGVTITLKGGPGYEAPWIVIHGRDVYDAGDMLEALRGNGAFTAVREAAREFQAAPQSMSRAVEDIQRAFPGSQVMSGNGGQELPGQYQEQCPHGPMTYVAQGKYGPFWACSLGRDDPRKCKARNAR